MLDGCDRYMPQQQQPTDEHRMNKINDVADSDIIMSNE